MANVTPINGPIVKAIIDSRKFFMMTLFPPNKNNISGCV